MPSKVIRIQTVIFISLFAVLLMGILMYLYKKSTSSILELKSGNKLAGQTFQVNNALQEIVNNIYTIENNYREQLNKKAPVKNNIADSGINKMKEYSDFISRLPKTDTLAQKVNLLSRLIDKKILFFGKLSENLPGKEQAKSLLFSADNNLINDSIYLTAITIQIIAENELQKKITQNFQESADALNLSKVFTLLALSAILILCTIIMINLLRKQRLIKDLELAKQKADNAAMIKEQFLANMSHEIRTPVNSIVGFTSLLQKTDLQQEQEQFVSHIKSSGENLLNIVNDILDISKIEAGMFHFQSEPFKLEDVCYYIEMMFYNNPKKENIDFRLLIDPEVPQNLIGDDERLKQILSNLITNAFKFTDKGFIHLEVQVADKTSDSVILNFSVKDSGIGIEKEQLQSIFERFEQLHNNSTGMHGGTGLGLSIVSQLVAMQGGTISVDSEPGKGSIFTFNMPFRLTGIQEEVNTKIIHGAEEDLSKPGPVISEFGNILAVEDNRMNQLLLKYFFKQLQVPYALAENGEEAIGLMKKENYDLVLLDIQMPVMDGYATAKYIREQLKSHVPIIAMTAFVLQGEKDKCFAFGMNDYLPKPIDERKLSQLISKYLPLKNGLNPETKNEYVDLPFLVKTFSGNKDFIDNILTLFTRQYPGDLDALVNAYTGRDVKLVKKLAHNLRSTVTSVKEQPPQLDFLHTLEQLEIENPDWELIKENISMLKNTLDRSIEEAQIALRINEQAYNKQ